MTQYTIFKVMPDGNLKISLNPELTREERKEARKLDWWELNEYNFCNGFQELDDFARCYIGALTDSPIISDGVIDEETTEGEYECTKIWWFPNYMVQDEKAILFSKGNVIFTLAD